LIESPSFIEQLKKRDNVAFNQLIDHFQNIIYNNLLIIVQHEQDAEDLTQEVFIRIHKSIDSFRGDSKLSTWVYRITYTTALEWERKKKANRAINYFKNLVGINENKQTISHFDHPGIAVENKEKANVLFKALKTLPENQRIAFLLIKSEGLSYLEVSEIMNKSIKSIEGLIQRAKENLRMSLEDYYNNN
jgi:RNA polymerase sigma factor (sigma-70 family)